jgi:hypothetical protein
MNATCHWCGSSDLHNVTTLDQATEKYVCAWCGWWGTIVPFWDAPCIGPMEGPAVPTPDELLTQGSLVAAGWLTVE